MRDPDFRSLLTKYDIALLQETHLRPDQEDQLMLPPGFDVFAYSRPNSDGMNHQFGGTMALVRHGIALEFRRNLSSPELLVLDLGACILVNVYWPPGNSFWYNKIDVSPQQRLAELLAGWSSLGDKRIVLTGDFNARTGTMQSMHGPERASPDAETINTLGRSLLQLCNDHDLYILNGTPTQTVSSMSLHTSFQAMGDTVIDYVLTNIHADGDVPQMEVGSESEWSDHAPVSLKLQIPCWNPAQTPAAQLARPRQGMLPAEFLPSLECRTELDGVMEAVVRSARPYTESVKALFGLVSEDVNLTAPVSVYTDGSCLLAGTSEARAGAGIYWGRNAVKNSALRVPGEQCNNRAELYAILYAIHTADSSTPLRLFTDSMFAIRMICYYVILQIELGWSCAHADILQDIVAHIRARRAPVQFSWVPGHSGNEHNEGADLQAKDGAALPAVGPYAPLAVPHDWVIEEDVVEHPEGPLKVFTTLPRVAQKRLREEMADALRDERPAPQEQHSLSRVELLRDSAMRDLLSSGSDAHFWQSFRELTGQQKRTPHVSAQQLREVFSERMNPPAVLPPHFDALQYIANHLWADSLAPHTIDHTDGQWFTRPLTLEDIARAKQHLRKTHSGHSAKGPDQLGYQEILAIPNNELLRLFQMCIAQRDSPQIWLTAIMAAIVKAGKKGKELYDPGSYRTIALECCLLKLLTLIIDRRLREWADSASALPPSQNGFRTGHRTNNNAFVLRTAIEKARSEKKTVYVAFVDLTNAFPSVDQATLWAKLDALGIGGPMIDWLRMLYSRIRYVVRHGEEFSTSFRSLAGILTGDPASPILWNIFFSDLCMQADGDDIILGGVAVSHLEQADDVALFSTSREGLQRKLDALLAWCQVNFMIINAIKTVCMIFGPLPPRAPQFYVNGALLDIVGRYTYVGMLFCSTTTCIFAAHREQKAEAARNIANASLSIEGYVGTLPAWASRTLYVARVDPHLTAGCEVAVDLNDTAIKALAAVQHTYWRRTLGLNSRSSLVVLYTETGIHPLRYRRISLVLRYLLYVLEQKPQLPSYALAEAVHLARSGAPSWISDLWHALHGLPIPVDFDYGNQELTGPYITTILAAVKDSLHRHLDMTVNESHRLILLQHRVEWNEDGKCSRAVIRFRNYLHVQSTEHRRAITRLLCSDHPLSIERGRRTATYTPREWRICRFCRLRGMIETESHVLLECSCPTMVELREAFFAEAYKHNRALPQARRSLHGTELLRAVIAPHKTLALVAQFAHRIFTLCEDIPPLLLASQEQLQALHAA